MTTSARGLLVPTVALVSFIGLFAQIGSCLKQRDVFEYVLHGPRLNENVRAAMLGLHKVREGATNAEIKEIIRLRADRLARIYPHLDRLRSSIECDSYEVLYCISILKQPELARFHQYVRSFGDKFASCAKREVETKMDEKLHRLGWDPADYFQEFEQMLRAALDYHSRSDLLERLRDLDLSEDSLDAVKVHGLANGVDLRTKVERKNKTKLAAKVKVQRYIGRLCLPYYGALRNSFDVINLAYLTDNAPFEGEKVLILNEFARFCVQWHDKKIRERLIDTMNRQLGSIAEKGKRLMSYMWCGECS